jgi:integrase
MSSFAAGNARHQRRRGWPAGSGIEIADGSRPEPVSAAAAEVRVLATVHARADDYAGHSKSPTTRRAYSADWRDFLQFCDRHGFNPLPAADETVAAYLAELADHGAKASTIARRLVAISQAHKAVDLPSPTTSSLVRRTHAGIRRTIGTAQQGKAPTLVNDLKRMLEALPDTRVGTRDRALLLLGFAGAFRRAELVSLDIEDLEFSRAGLVVTLRKSKTDQEQHGRRIGIPYGSSEATCPVRSLQTWLDDACITDGPVFRSMDRGHRVQPGRLSNKSVALIVKRRTGAVGLDPRRYAGHSLRAGLATSAASGGATEREIMQQTGHRSADMVRKYIREADLFKRNAAATAGL